MMKITVLEKLENGNYEVNFNLDGEDLGNREVTYEWIRADIVTGNKEIRYEFQTDIQFDFIQADEEEGEGFLYLVRIDIDEDNNRNQYDLETKVYKSFKRAVTQGQKLAEQMDTIFRNIA